MKNSDIRKMEKSGNREGIESYIRANVKRANERLRIAEKKGVSGYAVKAAKTKLGKNRFSVNFEGKTIEEISDEAKILNKFLESKTSTVGGQKEHLKNLKSAFENRGYDIGDPEIFEEILKSDIGSAYINIDSDTVVKMAARLSKVDPDDKDKLLRDIMQKNKEYTENKDVYIDTLWQEIALSWEEI